MVTPEVGKLMGVKSCRILEIRMRNFYKFKTQREESNVFMKKMK